MMKSSIPLLRGRVPAPLSRYMSRKPLPSVHEIQIRVRYAETDQGGVVYHGNYFAWFEMGRTELLRSCGYTYREMEEAGAFIVVAKLDCTFKNAARYDDLLTLRTEIKRITRFKLEHEYHLFRDGEPIAIAHTTLAVVDREGKIRQVPEWMTPEQVMDRSRLAEAD